MNDAAESIDPSLELSEKDFDALCDDPDFRELHKDRGGFNLFRVLRFEHGELRHSNMLGWLLTPDESHGLGDQFLRRWLIRVLGDASVATGLTTAELEAAPFKSVLVQREWRHIDVLVRITLERKEWVIAVENKIHASQSTDQLARYRRLLESSFPGAKQVHVFLRIDEDEKPDDPLWIVANHKQIADTLSECVQKPGIPIEQEPLVLINHYRQTIRRLSVPDDTLIARARRVYRRHKPALDFIFKQREDELALLSKTMERRMRHGAVAASIVPLACTKGYVRFVPTTWNTPQNRAGDAWEATLSAYVLCELVLGGDEPTLKIVESGAPEAWRTDLFKIAKREFATVRLRSKIPAQWMSIYQFRIPRPSDDASPEVVADAIWAAVEHHLAEDPTFKRASNAVVEHLRSLPLVAASLLAR